MLNLTYISNLRLNDQSNAYVKTTVELMLEQLQYENG